MKKAMKLKVTEKSQQKLTDIFPTVSQGNPTNVPTANANEMVHQKEKSCKVIKPFKEIESNLPVTFNEFLKYTNVLDIVTEAIISQRPDTHQLLLKNRKVLQNTARNAYFTFYTRPNHRHITPIILHPECPIDIRNKIFLIPEKYKKLENNGKRKKGYEQLFPDDRPVLDEPHIERTSSCSTIDKQEDIMEIPVVGLFSSIFPFPISLNQFKTNTNLDNTINAIIRDMNEVHKTIVEEHPEIREALLKDYYHAFYMTPSIRDIYKIELRSCPANVKKNTLQIPVLNNKSD